MMRFSGMKYLYSKDNISALGNGTIYCYISPNNLTGKYTAWTLGTTGTAAIAEYSLYVLNNRLYFVTPYSVIGGTQGEWYVDISAGLARGYVGVKYPFGGSTNTNPTIYIDGVKQTVTRVNYPSASHAHGADKVIIGADVVFLGGVKKTESNQFAGRLGEFSIHNTQHSDALMETITLARRKGYAYHMSKTDCVFYAPMDDIENVINIASSQTLTPNEDIAFTWATKTQSTAYASVAVDNETDYIRAGGADDSEAIELGFSTFTLPAGCYVSGVEFTVKGMSDTAEDAPSFALYKGSVYLETWTPTWSSSTITYNLCYDVQWTQAEIDSLRLKIIAPSSLGLSEGCTIYYVEAKIYYCTKPCREYISGNHLLGRNSTGAGDVYFTAF